KQHKSTYKAIHAESSISEPLQLLHVDLFRPTSVRSIDHKYYCLVITDDYSRFCWVFFLVHKDETYSTFKSFLNLVENQLNKKTPYDLLTGKIPTMSHFKPFGCHVTILNTSNHLGKFDGKADEGYLLGYSANFDCDEQVIIIPSYPSYNIQGTQPVDTPGDKVNNSPFLSAEEIFRMELAKLKDQEQQVTTNAEELRTPA
nr:ribonuclease H-like domain-containing protein [Tanacetum cinerariifolium]